MRAVLTFTAALVALTPAATRSQADSQALQRMVATERAFAAATAELGMRDGFLTFFAEDAVQIQRAATVTLARAREVLTSQALAKLPITNQLLWEPFTGHISSDGTLGWLTGGYVLLNQAQKETVGQGAYFSVWKRQPNGTYRVWLDEGIRLPQVWMNASPFRVAPEPDTGQAGTPAESLADAEPISSLDSLPVWARWSQRVAAEVRLHRDGVIPLVGRHAVVEWANKQPRHECKVLQTEIAASGDLGIVIAGCSVQGVSKPLSLVRVWKRDVTGRWRIVFQTENAN